MNNLHNFDFECQARKSDFATTRSLIYEKRANWVLTWQMILYQIREVRAKKSWIQVKLASRQMIWMSPLFAQRTRKQQRMFMYLITIFFTALVFQKVKKLCCQATSANAGERKKRNFMRNFSIFLINFQSNRILSIPLEQFILLYRQ